VKRPIARLVGTGRYTPSKVLTNADFERMVDTSDEWIRERSGIRERRIAEPHESIAFMGKAACVAWNAADVDMQFVQIAADAQFVGQDAIGRKLIGRG